MTMQAGRADSSSHLWERLRSSPDAIPKSPHLKRGSFLARFTGDVARLHFRLKEP